MKKLRVILLATVFVFALVAHATAEVFPLVESDFTGDEPITFNDVVIGELIPTQSSAVEFSQGLYGDEYFSDNYFGTAPGASNLDIDNVFPQLKGEALYEPVITVSFVNPVTRVGFHAGTPNGDIITVKVIRGDVETYEINHSLSTLGSFIGFQDTEGIDAIEISADGYVFALLGVLAIDNFRFGGLLDPGPTEPPVKTVKIDIKPPNCLEARIPINVKSQGVTPAVIIGDETYDVTNINPETVRLQGVEPVSYALEYASHCNAVEGDEMLDLTLKFNTQDLVQAIADSLGGEDLEDGTPVFLNLTGYLFDGTPITAEEMVSVTILVKGKQEKDNKGKGSK